MTALSSFAKFSRTSIKSKVNEGLKNAVVYTRVSSKEQADKNLSLDSQKNTIEDYASRNGFHVAGYFGGTYESAKTDGRKEFQRMLDYVKKSRSKITHILVYMLDRFSRTGGGAIKLAEDLREDYGVDIIAVTQPADTSNAGGVLQQSIQFIFSKYDNDLRKQRAIKGMKDKFAMGIWVVKAPMGYDIVKSGGERKIVINATGKKLKKAFFWKSLGVKNEDIIARLNALGVKMYKQQLTKILKNPFYCGMLVHGLLDGKVVEGKHEPMISKSMFLQINDIHQKTSGYGVSHKREVDEIPLKVFVRCGDCDTPFTGYIVRAKNLWYYKCRTNGCRCNKSAKEFHTRFLELLNNYCIQPHLIAPMQRKMELLWKHINKDTFEAENGLKKQLGEIDQKIENIEEGYYVNKEMSRELYDKFIGKLNIERLEISKELSKLGASISNPENAINKALHLS